MNSSEHAWSQNGILLCVALAACLGPGCSVPSKAIAQPPTSRVSTFSAPFEEVGAVDQAPRVLAAPAPAFPPAFQRRAGFVGSCRIEALVLSSGALSDAQIVESADPILGDAAIVAFKNWRFAPASKHRTPVNCRISITFVFTTLEQVGRDVIDEAKRHGPYAPFVVNPPNNDYRALPTRG